MEMSQPPGPPPLEPADAPVAPGRIPYLASLGWWREWFSLRLKGHSGPQAAALASAGYGKAHWNRSAVCREGEAPVLLSVPVEGGGRAARSAPPETLVVSGHGDWPRVHLGAMEAAWGRTPYWRHLRPLLEPLLVSSEGMPLLGLNSAIHEALLGVVGMGEGALRAYRGLRDENPGLVARLRADALERSGNLDETPAFLGCCCRLGPDAVWLL